MNKIILLATILFLTIYSSAQVNYLPNTIVVKLKNDNKSNTSPSSLPQAIESHLSNSIENSYAMFPNHNTGTKKSSTGLAQIFIVKTDGSEKHSIYNELSNLPEVEYAIPYYLPELLGEVNDPYASSQYYLPIIQAYDAHELQLGDTNVTIGITDTGLDMLHPDLIDNIKLNYNDPINGIDDDMDGFVDNFRGWDVADNDNNPSRLFSSHGTMVAGFAAATCNNSTGIYSIGYNTKFMPIKIMDSRGYLSGAYQGIVYAADHGCQIINCSWGGQIPNPLCEDVIAYAINERNCLVIAAAGNSSTDQPFYPASCEGVLSVANTDGNDLKFSKSTYGIEVDIAAPGTNVLSTNGSNSYKRGWGTSYSAPIVAGAAALVKAKYPEYNGLQIGEQLRITADIIDTLTNNLYFYRHMGRGRLNAYKALSIDSLPSLRILNLIVESEHSTPLPGDELQTTFEVTNYLKQLTNTVIQLSIDSEYATPSNNIFHTEKLSTLESTSNINSPMLIQIAEEVPYDQTIELDFKFKGEGYDDYQIFKQLINPSFINIDAPPIETSFTSNGSIGFANAEQVLGKGLVYKNQTNMLPSAGIIIGYSREDIASAVAGEYDFEIDQVIDTTSTENNYLVGSASYVCGEKYDKLPITINQKTKIKRVDELEGTIFYEYKVINESASDINDFAFSIFTDWDIDNSNSNRMKFEEDINLFYAQSTTDNNFYTGLSLISQDSCIPYAFDLVEGGNGGLDIVTSFSDDKKWFAMTNPRYTDNNLVDTVDVAGMLTSVKQTLKANDTLTYIFCMVVADSYYDLMKKSYLAHEEYFEDTVHIKETLPLSMNVYPNPASNNIHITLASQYSYHNLSVYNNMGQLMDRKSFYGNEYSYNTNSLANGIYNLVLDNSFQRKSIQIVVNK